MSYKMVAGAMGSKAYRAVGSALKNNPYAPIVPCHRVVASDGKLGGFMGDKSGKNIEIKIKMLRDEGVEVVDGKIDKKYFYKEKP